MTNPKSHPQRPIKNSPTPPIEGWLEIGTIVAPQGVDGEVRVYPNSDFPERFEQPGKRWLLKPGDTEPQPIELLASYYLPGKGLYVLQFAGVDDRDRAEVLRGCRLMVPETDRPTLCDDEYHVLDLFGIEVFHHLTGETVGVVVDVIAAGNDLLVVKISGGDREVFIPFVKAIVPVVDLQQRRIEITPPPGLLELN